MKFKLNFDDTAQNRLIIAGLLVSTVLIIAVSIFAIGKIQEKLYESYANFGQLLGKTIAIQSYELTKNKPQNEKIKILKSHSVSILESNSDISFITFKDDKGNIIFSTSENFKDKAENTKTNLSAPITNENGKIEGTVEIGLNASMASAIAKTTKNSMFIVFTLVWAVFTIVILINTFLITRELSILHQGVKAISGGKFGTLLEHKEVSGEIKELFSAFNDMSSRLHIYEEQNIEELTLERNKFESVLMSIANGVIHNKKQGKDTPADETASVSFPCIWISSMRVWYSHTLDGADTCGCHLDFFDRITSSLSIIKHSFSLTSMAAPS